MFKATLLVFMLAALSVAHPGSGNKFPSSAHHKLARQASNINSTNDDNSTSVVSNEVLPNFVLPCKCAEPFCDSRMSSKSVSSHMSLSAFTSTSHFKNKKKLGGGGARCAQQLALA